MRNFKELNIWKTAVEITPEIYALANSFPQEEKFGLSSQIKRAMVSIPSNIAEGCSRNSNLEFIRFLEIALGSGFELETQLEIATRLGYLESEKSEATRKKLLQLQIMISNYRTYLKKNFT